MLIEIRVKYCNESELLKSHRHVTLAIEFAWSDPNICESELEITGNLRRTYEATTIGSCGIPLSISFQRLDISTMLIFDLAQCSQRLMLREYISSVLDELSSRELATIHCLQIYMPFRPPMSLWAKKRARVLATIALGDLRTMKSFLFEFACSIFSIE